MGGARRALNRSNCCKRQTLSNPSFAKKPFVKFKNRDQGNSDEVVQPVLKLIQLTPEQENREDIQFIFEQIPQNVKDLKSILKKELKKTNAEDPSETTKLVLQRIRDYYHPLGTKNVATDE